MPPGPKSKRRVVILFNQDFDPSLSDYTARADVDRTAHALAAGIDASDRFRAELLPIGGAPLDFARTLQERAPDVVFNLCESLNQDARHEALVPAVLDLLGLPYTGSKSLTLATALRKDRTKELLTAHGIRNPESMVVDRPLRGKPPFRFPVIVKPVREDGSLGISPESVVHSLRALNKQVGEILAAYKQPALIEQFIDGREINVPLLGNDSFEKLPLGEMDFSTMPSRLPKIVTYRGKWEEDSEEYRGSVARLDPKLSPSVARRVWRMASDAFLALECSGYGRIDLRLDSDGEPYVIDLNPNCDLSPQGGFFRACRAAGMTYSDMATRIVQLALANKETYGTPNSKAVSSRSRAA